MLPQLKASQSAIVVMAQDEATLTVSDSQHEFNGSAKADPTGPGAMKAYGIGLLLQGDLKGAEQAFVEARVHQSTRMAS